MKFYECDQGSDSWHSLRVGVVTASRFRDAREKLKNGKQSQKSYDYACDIALERICGERVDDVFVTKAMRLGSEREPFARMAYEMASGNLASESGIALTDDGHFGYSSDGIVGDEGLIEIKCPSSSRKIIETWMTCDLSEYIDQMQGGLWITGRQWCDFIMYCPWLEPIGKELFVKRVHRDDDYIESLEGDLLEFHKMVSRFVESLAGKNTERKAA
jgi:exodeoxyribonuclease (lambda-induced)